MNCPNCEREVPREEDRTTCECGTPLRWFVPIFGTGEKWVVDEMRRILDDRSRWRFIQPLNGDKTICFLRVYKKAHNLILNATLLWTDLGFSIRLIDYLDVKSVKDLDSATSITFGGDSIRVLTAGWRILT